ncbi:MAG: hypothetical protein L0I76_37600 [Pseudonocardia sp.]|nr:hypothetical protein [Pseudonocardia sp.]
MTSDRDDERAVRERWGDTALSGYLLAANQLHGPPLISPYRGTARPGVISEATRNLALDALAQAVPPEGLDTLTAADALRLAEVAAAVSTAATLEYRFP